MEHPSYPIVAMPRVSRFKPPPIRRDESLGERLARLRKERGFTQKELAGKTGLIQALISDYERDKLRLNADMVLRFATALEITTDDLLQPCGPKPARKPSRGVLSRFGADRSSTVTAANGVAKNHRHVPGECRLQSGAPLSN